VGSLEGVSFFLERQMRLLCFIERREGKGRKEKTEKMSSSKGSNEGSLLFHTVVYVCVCIGRYRARQYENRLSTATFSVSFKLSTQSQLDDVFPPLLLRQDVFLEIYWYLILR